MTAWPTGEMTALRVTPGAIDIGRAPIPPETHGEVLVEVAYVGICGTDVELFHGDSYYIDQGLNAYPVLFGHEWTGVVAAVAEGVTSVAPGDQVIGQTIVTCGTCPACHAGRRTSCTRRAEVGLFGRQGAAARYVSMPATALTRLAPRTSLADAVLIEPGVTAMAALTRTGCAFDDRVAVIGTGTLGLISAAIALRITPNVDVIGIEEQGLAIAAALGARRTIRPEAAEPSSYGVVIEASGAQAALALLGQILEPGGRGALAGVVNTGARDFVPAFVTLKDITLHGILHGLEHYDRVAELIASKAVPAGLLVDRVVPWRDAASAFRLMTDRALTRPKVLIDMSGMS